MSPYARVTVERDRDGIIKQVWLDGIAVPGLIVAYVDMFGELCVRVRMSEIQELPCPAVEAASQ